MAALLVMILPMNLGAQEQEVEDVYKGIEFEMPRVKETSFPDYSRSIIDFGAKAGGLEKNTDAFEKTIADVSSNGGGRVVVPRGIWLTGPIILKSNINLHLENGALILFSRDFDDYHLIDTSFEGLNTVRNISPIYAKGVENIAITGKGTIDGNGDAWRPVKRGKMTDSQWKKLVNSGGVVSVDGKMWFPSEGSKKGHDNTTDQNVPDMDREELKSVKDFLRPVMVSIRESKRVLLDGPTFQNSPAWNIHPLMSEDIIIRNINVRNPWYSQNGDGLDIESCKNVLVYNNTFDVGDDAICIKSGKNQDGRDRGIPTENIIIKNNIVYHGHGGFVVGSEMSGGARNIHVSNCTFMGTDVGLRFKSTRGRGGVVENIYISDIDMIDIPTEGIRFNMFYEGQAPVLDGDETAGNEVQEAAAKPVTVETPSFRNIFMKNIKVNGSNRAAFFMGLPEMSLENVHLEDAVLKGKEGVQIIDGSNISLKNVTVLQENGPALIIYNSEDILVKDFDFNKNPEGKAIRVMGDSENVDVSGANVSQGDIEKKLSTSSSKKKVRQD